MIIMWEVRRFLSLSIADVDLKYQKETLTFSMRLKMLILANTYSIQFGDNDKIRLYALWGGTNLQKVAWIAAS